MMCLKVYLVRIAKTNCFKLFLDLYSCDSWSATIHYNILEMFFLSRVLCFYKQQQTSQTFGVFIDSMVIADCREKIVLFHF